MQQPIHQRRQQTTISCRKYLTGNRPVVGLLVGVNTRRGTNEAALQQCNTCHYRSIMPKTVTTVCEYGWSMAILVWGHIMEVEACQRRTVMRREYKADDRNSHVLHSDMYHYWLWMTPGPRNMNKAFQLFQKAALTAIEKISIHRFCHTK